MDSALIRLVGHNRESLHALSYSNLRASATQLDSFQTDGENNIMDENNKDYNSL